METPIDNPSHYDAKAVDKPEPLETSTLLLWIVL